MHRHGMHRLGMRPASLAKLVWAFALAGLAASFAPVAAGNIESSWHEVGEASWYGGAFAGRPTASGETYDPRNLTAAHKSLPLGSLVRVHNLENDRRMIVRINDRGPFVRGRVIDVSEAAAEVLGFKEGGTADVRITPVAAPPGKPLPREWAETRRSEDRVSPPAGAEIPARAPTGAAAPAAASAAPASAGSATASPAGAVYVQLGAYRDSRRANEQVHSAAGLGMALLVEYVDGMYRVLAGPFESNAAAERAVSDLSRAGLNAFVRKD